MFNIRVSYSFFRGSVCLLSSPTFSVPAQARAFFIRPLLLTTDFGRRYFDGQFGGKKNVGVGTVPDFL